MNNVSIMGRHTKEPELNRTDSGNAVLNFSLAVDGGKVNGERQTDFIDCVAWGKTAEHIATYYSKGQLMAATGMLKTRRWEDRNGDKHKVTEVLVFRTYFCGSKKDNNGGEYKHPLPAGVDIIEDEYSELEGYADDENELPF